MLRPQQAARGIRYLARVTAAHWRTERAWRTGVLLWVLSRVHSVGASLEKEEQVVVLLFFQELH